jgi:signal transduction histidine kinase
VRGDLAADVEAVVLEGVSNAVRHSGGRHVTVTVDVADHVTVEILDDGRGIDVRGARSGLRNLERRALRHDGELTVEAPASGGTRVRWSARLRWPATP